ncbi:MAG: CPBP family intramembrane metalloprotease [Saprospiraceae bacterium]|nr:CPBP family intramembrane metalloprotease [Saprospiraceae bacterium]
MKQIFRAFNWYGLLLYLGIVACYTLGLTTYGQSIFNWLNSRLPSYLLAYPAMHLVLGLPAILWTLSISRMKSSLLKMSLDQFKQLLLPVLWTGPMFLGYGAAQNFSTGLSSSDFWTSCVYAAFFEEVFYRGIFFGMLFRYTRLGFIPSLLLSALVFACMHLYQGKALMETTGIFFITFLAAGFFAWLYVEWRYHLWLIILLHFLMNLSWGLFDVAENALGSGLANAMRTITIASAIITTLLAKKSRGHSLAVNRSTLFLKPLLNSGCPRDLKST